MNDSVSYFTSVPKGKIVWDLFCACCGKRMGLAMCDEGEPLPTRYCADCTRAIRVAQMQAAGTLPKV